MADSAKSNRSASYTIRYATLGGLLAILLWSTTIALVRSLSESIGPLSAATCVYLIAGLFCLIPPMIRGKSLVHFRTLPNRYLLGCGFLFIAYMALLYLGIGLGKDRQQVLEIGLLNYLWPALTILFSVILLKKQASLFLPVGTLLALWGVVMAMSQGSSISWNSFLANVQSNFLAYLFGFLAACSWALYSNLTCRWETKMDRAVDLYLPVTGLVFWIIRWLYPEEGIWNMQCVGEACFLGGVTALAYALWENAMRKGDVLIVAAFSYCTPLLSTLVSCVYLKVMPGPRLWIGCVLIIIGSIISWRSVSSRT